MLSWAMGNDWMLAAPDVLPLFNLPARTTRRWMTMAEHEDHIVLGMLERACHSTDDELLHQPGESDLIKIANLFNDSAPFDQQWLGVFYQRDVPWSGTPKSTPP